MNKVLAIGCGILLAGFTSATAFADTIVGVGLVLEKKTEKAFVITEVIPNSPAATTGKIEVGHMITEVQTSPDAAWERVYGKTLEEVVAMIRGELSVAVGIKTYNPADNAITEMSIVRGEIEVQNKDGGATLH